MLINEDLVVLKQLAQTRAEKGSTSMGRRSGVDQMLCSNMKYKTLFYSFENCVQYINFKTYIMNKEKNAFP